MSSYRFTPQAIDNLFEIWSYIASDDPDAPVPSWRILRLPGVFAKT